jgi:hypothetical protein
MDRRSFLKGVGGVALAGTAIADAGPSQRTWVDAVFADFVESHCPQFAEGIDSVFAERHGLDRLVCVKPVPGYESVASACVLWLVAHHQPSQCGYISAYAVPPSVLASDITSLVRRLSAFYEVSPAESPIPEYRWC